MAGNNTQDIKRRIKSVTGIEHITNAMKLVSAAKLRRARATYEKTREYFHYVTESIEDIFNEHPGDIPSKYLLSESKSKSTAYIIVTSNRGLAGSFNSNIIKRAETAISKDPAAPYLITIGSRGTDHFARRNHNIVGEYNRPPESISFLETAKISRPVIELYDEGKVDEVELIYTTFISSIEQRVKKVRLLPFEMSIDPEIMPGERYMEYDPGPVELLNYLVPKYVEIMVYGAIVESATCEHAARRLAMENATDNAQEMISDLNLFYNRARQAAITREITEIVSGADALE
jgi:F-type H+-transporting ATPase subunit gamma